MLQRRLRNRLVFIMEIIAVILFLAEWNFVTGETTLTSKFTTPKPNSIATPAQFDMHSCVAHPDGIYADPFDCHRYYHCVRQKTFYFRCFDGFVFDPCKRRCIYQRTCITPTEGCQGTTPVPLSAGEISKNSITDGDSDQVLDVQINNKDGGGQKNVSRLVVDRLGKNETSEKEKGKGLGENEKEGHDTENGASKSNHTIANSTSSSEESTEEPGDNGTTASPEEKANDNEKATTPRHRGGTSPSHRNPKTSPKNGNEENEGATTPEGGDHENNSTEPSERGETSAGHPRTTVKTEEGPEKGTTPKGGHKTSPKHRGSTPPSKENGTTSTNGYDQTPTPESDAEEKGTTIAHRGQTYLVRVIFNRRIFESGNTTNNNNPNEGSIELTTSPSTPTKKGHTPNKKSTSSPELKTTPEPETVENPSNKSIDNPESHSNVKSNKSDEIDSETSTTKPNLKNETEGTTDEKSSESPKTTEKSTPANTTEDENNSEAASTEIVDPKNNTDEKNGKEKCPPRSISITETKESKSSHKNKTDGLSLTWKEDIGIGKSNASSTKGNKCVENATDAKNEKNSTREKDREIKEEDSVPFKKDQKKLLEAFKTDFTPPLNFRFIAGQTIASKLGDLIGELNVTMVCRTPPVAASTAQSSTCQCPNPDPTPKVDIDSSNSSVKENNQSQKFRCRSLTCFNGAMYIELSNGQCGCLCPTGWRGDRCQHLIDHSTCHCANGGRCVSVGNGTFACLCPLGYLGGQCQYPYTQSSTINGESKFYLCDKGERKCQNGGICLRDSNGNSASNERRESDRCFCPLGFTGDSCQNKI